MNRVSYVNSTMTQMLGVNAKIDNLSIGFNGIDVQGLEIDNPPGSTLNKACSIGLIRILFNPMDLFSNPVSVQLVGMDNSTLGIEMYSRSGDDNNWKRLIDNMGSGQTAEEPAEEAPASEGRNIHLDRLLLTNIQLEVFGPGLGKDVVRPSPIKKIELTDLGTDRPLPVEELTSLIVQKVMQELISLPKLGSILQDSLLEGVKLPGKAIEKIIPLKDAPIFEKIDEKPVEKILDSVFGK